jgi:hypothetical protein
LHKDPLKMHPFYFGLPWHIMFVSKMVLYALFGPAPAGLRKWAKEAFVARGNFYISDGRDIVRLAFRQAGVVGFGGLFNNGIEVWPGLQ